MMIMMMTTTKNPKEPQKAPGDAGCFGEAKLEAKLEARISTPSCPVLGFFGEALLGDSQVWGARGLNPRRAQKAWPCVEATRLEVLVW